MPWQVLCIALLMAFGMWMPLSVTPVVEDIIEKQLAVSHALTALLFSAPVAMLALVAIPGGFLADKIGIKKAIGAGIVILATGSALRGISTDYASLLGFTLVYGLGLGLSFPNLPKLARNCTTRDRSNITVGLFTTAILVSGALALAIIRPVIYPLTHSFQGAFFISSIPAMLAAVLWWLFIHDPPCEIAGEQAVNVGLASLRKVITRPDLWLVAVLFLTHNFVLYTILGWMPSFLTSIGVVVAYAGLDTSVIFWAGAVSIILLTQLSTRLGRRKPFIWGPSILLIITSLVALVIDAQASWYLMILIGLATAIRFTMIITLPVELVGPGHAGSASGLVMSVGYIGALAGPVLSGLILDSTHSFHWIFISMAIVSAVTAILAFIIPETGKAKNG
jgi:MFS transporter, CP family, cyanate transporter